jgi:predicted RNA-binding Zn ribbon-like protein
METTPRWAHLVAGDMALDFVNTDVVSEHDRSRDVLRAAEEFAAWSAYAQLPGATPTMIATHGAHSQDVLDEARSLRTATRSVIEAIINGGAPEDQALSTIQAAYARAIGDATPVISDGRLSWRWTTNTPKALVARLAVAVITLLRDGPTDRIKACPACGFVFIDTTKNRRRRWCSMDDCGKEEKIRRYVAKRAETSRRTRVG